MSPAKVSELRMFWTNFRVKINGFVAFPVLEDQWRVPKLSFTQPLIVFRAESVPADLKLLNSFPSNLSPAVRDDPFNIYLRSDLEIIAIESFRRS